tara:strand:+ start:348 stop:548 length:201 start_codon:yes stop_codon:yes gene_type:complete
MKYLEKIIKIQNELLLNNIANIKFDNEPDKRTFVNKYLKKNYHLFKLVNNNNNIKIYSDKVDKMNL